MNIQKRILRLTLIILLSLTVLLVVSIGILSHYAQKKAETVLKSFDARVSSIHVNLLTRSVTINDLAWTSSTDSLSTVPHHFQAQSVRISGFSYYQLLRHKKLHINNLSVTGGLIHYNNKLHHKVLKSAQKAINLKSISIGLINLENISTNLIYDTLLEYAGVVNLTLHDIQLTDIKKANDLSHYILESIEGNITQIRLHEKESMYTTSISQLYINSDNHQVTIDSVYLIPTYSKYDFSRKVGRQIDRFSGSFPKISITGLIFNNLKDSLFTASKVHIASAELYVYRDKRLPFIKGENTPLPMELIRSLSFGAAIDTVKITNAKITYEEFPEKGFQTGQVTFERLNASLDHLSNRDYYSNYKQSTLIVSSNIMEKGVINAEFSLPYGEPQIYNAKGSIRNLELNHLNPILENLAFISITSGMLNQLTFNFDYNDFVSRGTLLVNYDNLKIVSMTKEKESTKNEFKSWILNVALRKDKDKSVDKVRRTGTIYIERDRKRAVFNVWVKSLFSGLKSSVLDSSTKKEREK
jgi:Domain of Unknown Function (DUF748)